MISALMIADPGGAHASRIILGMRSLPLGSGQLQAWQAAGAGAGAALALGLASILKARLLSQLLGAPVQGWRWSLILGGAGGDLGRSASLATLRARMGSSCSVGVPAILSPSAWSIWYRGFTDDDRELFRKHAARRREEPSSARPVGADATRR